MNRFNVFLDTNIFIRAKFNFHGGSLQNLKKYCETGTAVLFTNDIIVREVRSHIDADVGSMAKQAKNAIKNHGELVNAISREVYQTIEATILGATENLTSQFDAYIEGAIFLPNEGLSVVDLFNDYFNKCAPFEKNEKKKSEFPDAAVIMSIKRYMAETDATELHIVSDDDGWHDALVGIEGISLYKSLSELLTKIAEDEKELYDQVSEYMEKCIGDLQSYTEDWFTCQDWSTSIESIDMCIECEDIEDIYVTTIDLTPDAIEYIDREGEFASAVFSGVVTFYLGFQYIDHSNESYDREDHIWYNTVYGKGAAELKVAFTGSTTILIPENGEMELNSLAFDEMNLGDIEIMDYKLIPYRNDDDPYFATCPDCCKPIGIHNDGGNGFCIDCAPNH